MIKMNKKGFTLVEVMIVVAIIGMLATIAIPNFIRARDTARRTTCIANLRRIHEYTGLWAIDNNKSGNDIVTMDNLVPDYIKKTPTCPSGGDYVLTIVDAIPTCTHASEGHEI